MANYKNEIPTAVDHPVLCSICLESTIKNNSKATTTLKCGHIFHLCCIGCEFNVKGVMQCPNCRVVENSDWLFCAGNPSEPAELNVNDPEENETTEADDDDEPLYEIQEEQVPQLLPTGFFCNCPYHRNLNNADGDDHMNIPRETIRGIFQNLGDGSGNNNNIASSSRIHQQPPPPPPPPISLFNENNSVTLIDVAHRIRNYLPVIDGSDPQGAIYGVETFAGPNRERNFIILGRNDDPPVPPHPSDSSFSPDHVSSSVVPLRWAPPPPPPPTRPQERSFIGMLRPRPRVVNQGTDTASTSSNPLDSEIFMENLRCSCCMQRRMRFF